MSLNGHGTALGRKQEAAIVALLTAATIEHAAEAAGIGRATLVRWLRDRDFKRAYDTARREALDGALRALHGSALKATRTLVALLDVSHEPTRLGAARTLLELALRSHDDFDIRARLDRIEEADAERAAERMKGWHRGAI